MTQLFKEHRAGKIGGRYWIIMGYWSIKKFHCGVIPDSNEGYNLNKYLVF